MKKCFILTIALATILLSVKTNAQDIITKKDGSEIQSKVTEVTTTEIKYKKFDNQTGPTYTMPRSEAFMIKYENGTKDVFANESSKVSTITSENDKNKVIDNSSPTSKGRYFLSPNLAYKYPLDLLDGYSVLDLSLNFDNGYFIGENLAITSTIGGDYVNTSTSSHSTSYYSTAKKKYINTGTVAGTSSSTFLFTYGGGLRYYIAEKIFLGASLISSTKDFSNNISCAYFQAGYAHFLTKSFALESSVSYVMGIGDADGYKAIQAKLGVGYYF